MSDRHIQTFFGQNTGLTVQSNSKKERFIYVKFSKKKEDGTWERPSKGEGKTIKCNLEEIVMMLRVLEQKDNSWSKLHSNGDSETEISFYWEKEGESKVWVKMADKSIVYSEMLDVAQAEVLRMLLKHLLKEKIKYATVPLEKGEKSGSEQVTVEGIEEESVKGPVELSEIKGAIKGETEKGVLVSLASGQEIWVPKSKIHSKYSNEKEVVQSFVIETWILKKNKLI